MTDAHSRSYPVLRVILATTQALDDIASAIRAISARIDDAERAGSVSAPQAEGLLESATRVLADQDALSRYASRISTTKGELTLVEVPKAIQPLLLHYLHDTLSPKLIEMVASRWPDARSQLQPDFSGIGNFSDLLRRST